MILSFTDTLDKWNQSIQSFLEKYVDNPIFWGVVFLGGIFIVMATYGSLHKND